MPSGDFLHIWICSGEGLENGIRDVAAHGIFPAPGSDQALDHTGTQFRDITGGHEEDGGDFRCEVRIDVAHDTLVFVVIRGAHPSQDVGRILFLGVVDQIAIIEVGEGEALTGGDGGFQELEALRNAEAVIFFGIGSDCDNEAIEKLQAALNHPEMTVCWRVEAPGIDSGVHDSPDPCRRGRHVLRRIMALRFSIFIHSS